MKPSASAKGISISLAELIALRKFSFNFTSNQKKTSKLLPGQRITEIRGRGIEFDSTREYQPGDDIRHMAWRVTARTLKPHVKVYREDKERPVWLAMDLSPSLYFGTRVQFKSVCSLQQACLLGWSFKQAGEKVGAILVTSEGHKIFKPLSRESDYLLLLQAFSQSTFLKPDYTQENYLDRLLTHLLEHVRTGQRIYLFSDFYGWSPEVEKKILILAQRTQLYFQFIYDPFEVQAPPPREYLLTNGQQKIIFNTQTMNVRERYAEQFQKKKNLLKQFVHKHHIGFRLHCTSELEEVVI